MPTQPKPRKVGRPKLPKDAAKGKTVQVRLNIADHKAATRAAKHSHQTLSEWIRSMVHTATVIE